MKSTTKTTIKNLINKHKILVFIKGERRQPLCGFSNKVITILNSLNIDYYAVNVLKNLEMREGIKIYSHWPTIPQIYINGEFIGGADILTNLYEKSELGEILEKALNS